MVSDRNGRDTMNRRQVISAICVAAPILQAARAKAGPLGAVLSTPKRVLHSDLIRVDVSDLGGESADRFLNDLFKRTSASFGLTGRRAHVLLPNRRIRLSSPLCLLPGVDLSGAGASCVLDISRANMAPAIVAIKTRRTLIESIAIVGSGRGLQPANVVAPGLGNFIQCGSGIIFVGVSEGVIRGVSVNNFGGVSGSPPYNGVAGIWLTGGCSECIVRDCKVASCRNGINEDNYFRVDPRSNRIINNIVADCRFGIALDSGKFARGTVVESNFITNCLQSGIDLNKSIDCIVRYNHVTGCGTETGNSGIFIYGSPRYVAIGNVVQENVVKGCRGSGIRSGPYATNNHITRNTVVQNGRYGVQSIGGNNIIEENNASANKLASYG